MRLKIHQRDKNLQLSGGFKYDKKTNIFRCVIVNNNNKKIHIYYYYDKADDNFAWRQFVWNKFNGIHNTPQYVMHVQLLWKLADMCSTRYRRVASSAQITIFRQSKSWKISQCQTGAYLEIRCGGPPANIIFLGFCQKWIKKTFFLLIFRSLIFIFSLFLLSFLKIWGETSGTKSWGVGTSDPCLPTEYASAFQSVL